MPTRIQIRRDSTDRWTQVNPVLGIGEPGYDLNTHLLKIGDGSTRWSDLPGYLIAEADGDLPDVVLSNLQQRNDARYVRQSIASSFQRAGAVSVAAKTSPDGTYEYEVVTVHAPRGGLNAFVEKVYGDNYEQTWTGGDFSPPTRPFANYQQLAGAYVVLSSDAFQGGMMSGLQIKNGAVYRGWGNYSNDPRVGRETLALMFDGTWQAFYSSSSTPQQVRDAGADTTFGFGPLVVIDGAARSDIGSSATWGDWVTSVSGRHLLGHNAAGDLVSIIVKGATGASGIAGVEMANVALREGCVNAIMLDGGGSVQGRSSFLFHPSSDAGGNRDVANAVAIKVPLLTPITVAPSAISYLNGFTANTAGFALGARKSNGRTRLYGTGQLASVTANTWYTVGALPARLRPGNTADSFRSDCFFSGSGYAGNVSISPTDGTIQVKAPVTATNSYWQFDDVEFDAAY